MIGDDRSNYCVAHKEYCMKHTNETKLAKSFIRFRSVVRRISDNLCLGPKRDNIIGYLKNDDF